MLLNILILTLTAVLLIASLYALYDMHSKRRAAREQAERDAARKLQMDRLHREHDRLRADLTRAYEGRPVRVAERTTARTERRQSESSATTDLLSPLNPVSPLYAQSYSTPDTSSRCDTSSSYDSGSSSSDSSCSSSDSGGSW